MKQLICLALLSVTSLSYASEQLFTCDNGLGLKVELGLTENVAKFGDLTLLNYLDVDYSNRLRGYAFINDPWFDLDLDTSMLNGKNGLATLRSHQLSRYEWKSETYTCEKVLE